MKNSIPTNRVQLRTCLRILCVALFLNPCQGWAEELTASQRGYRNLTTKAYLPSDFDQDIFDDLWTVWEEPLRSRAEKATVDSRRAMAMERYGLLPQQKLPSHALQYVVAPNGNWAMSCLACHQGQVAGKIFPGLPNTNYALETLTEEVRSIKIRQQKSLGHMDLGSLLMPLGTTNGTTNAVMFGVALMRYRDKDLNIVARPFSFDMVHHDVDAPAWWHYAKRDRIYADGFAPKGHRILMQFLLVKENGPLQFAAWEDDFRDIEAWLLELKSPPWEWEVDTASASVGRHLFENHCADCHGSYGAVTDRSIQYPNRIVSIDEIGTDRVRYDSLTRTARRNLMESWFAHSGLDGGDDNPSGYVAPPLDGIWATAPYLHNGSVPTLWHLLHSSQRPRIWKRTPSGYDQQRIGLDIECLIEMPSGPLSNAQRRGYFDTRRIGKSAAGHDFQEALDENEKKALLEYLKTI